VDNWEQGTGNGTKNKKQKIRESVNAQAEPAILHFLFFVFCSLIRSPIPALAGY
jgi:hypothetical protein